MLYQLSYPGTARHGGQGAPVALHGGVRHSGDGDDGAAKSLKNFEMEPIRARGVAWCPALSPRPARDRPGR
jgi:hypothetical protein